MASRPRPPHHLHLALQMPDRLRVLHPTHLPAERDHRTLPRRLRIIPDHHRREPDLKRHHLFQFRNLLITQMNTQRLHVVLQLLHLPPAHNRKHIRRLLHHVRQRHRGNTHPLAHLSRDLLQRSRHIHLVGCQLRRAHDRADLLARLLLRLNLGLRLEAAAADGAPGGQGQPEVPAHGDDVALEVAACDGPEALVDDEGGLAVGSGVGVGRGDDPGGRVGDAEVEDFAGGHEVVESVRDLGVMNG